MSLGVYVLGALEPDERVLVEAHLAECAECAAELAELSGVATFLGRVSEGDVAQVASPPAVVLDRLLSAKAKRRRTARLMLVLAASVLVVGLGGGTLWAVTQSLGDAAPVAAPAADSAAQDQAAQDQAAQDQAAQGQAEPLSASAAAPEARAKASPTSAPSAESQLLLAPSDLRVTGRDGDGTVRAVVTASAGQGATTVKVVLTGVAKGTRCRLDVIGDGGVRETAGNWTVNRAAYDESGAFTATTTIPPERITSFEIATAEGRVLLTVAAR